MHTVDFIPDDLDGETALKLADLFYQLADEILSRNYGAIRDHYDHAEQMRLQTRAPAQLSFYWPDQFDDILF